MKKRKYAVVGTGGRIPMFIDPIVNRYRESSELVGLCDISRTRMEYHRDRLKRSYDAPDIPLYPVEDFERMIKESGADTVIVCTPDYLHEAYIVRALDAGCDVIAEKPLVVNAEQCRAVFEAIERSGRKVRTAFNFRWSPGVSKVRELIAKGEIGAVKHIDFEYMLNTSHGADYFRRWHSQKELSGGLLVHKSTHHFDLINWWADGIPETVFGMGDLVFYGKENAIARGQEELTRYDRYTGADTAGDPFALSLDSDATLTALYKNAEADSGYVRDQNVFRDGITIEDTMSVMVRYRNGVVANYSLNCFCPCEGFRVSITGDAGRIEYVEEHSSHIITGDADAKKTGPAEYTRKLTIQKLFQEPVLVPVPHAEGGHGGGDVLIQEQMFDANPPVDPLGRGAGHEQGAASCLIGIAANRSMATGEPVRVADLLKLAPQATRLSELR